MAFLYGVSNSGNRVLWSTTAQLGFSVDSARSTPSHMGSAASSSRSLRPSPRDAPASRVCTEDTAVRACNNKATADGDNCSGQAGRHRIAYRAPTLGGSREASAENGCRTRNGEGISEPALQPSSALKPKADTFVRRARSSLVTADGLVNSGDVESTVKQRRRTKKLPSASAMCADDETRSVRERPGSAYARSAHAKAASSAAHTSRWVLTGSASKWLVSFGTKDGASFQPRVVHHCLASVTRAPDRSAHVGVTSPCDEQIVEWPPTELREGRGARVVR